jgi:hypothetical protein
MAGAISAYHISIKSAYAHMIKRTGCQGTAR